MFGYIKPYKPELRVCELEAYKSVYCGLCRSMGKHTGCVSRLTLSYDFAFLAIVRMVLLDITPDHKLHRCFVHPIKKRMMCEDNEVLAFAAASAGILTDCKFGDDVLDEKGAKKIAARFARIFTRRIYCRVCDKAPAKAIEASLLKLSQLEGEKCASIDTVADTFGELLSEVMAYGIDGANKRIAAEIGRCVGRYIYVLDACDDYEDDVKEGKYNPLIYSEYSPEALQIAVRLELSKLEAAVNLLDFANKPELEGIIKNIIYLGMTREADRVFKLKNKKENI